MNWQTRPGLNPAGLDPILCLQQPVAPKICTPPQESSMYSRQSWSPSCHAIGGTPSTKRHAISKHPGDTYQEAPGCVLGRARANAPGRRVQLKGCCCAELEMDFWNGQNARALTTCWGLRAAGRRLWCVVRVAHLQSGGYGYCGRRGTCGGSASGGAAAPRYEHAHTNKGGGGDHARSESVG